jgi:DNA-binding MarR family transcriptional regulator
MHPARGSEVDQAVLQALRRLIRATDLDARELARQTGLSTSQLLVMELLRGNSGLGVSAIARAVGLTQGTVTTLLDRLEERALVMRHRSAADRRLVHVSLTYSGIELLAAAPTPLQTRFLERFAKLRDWERHAILASLQRVGELMGAENIDAAPVLDVGHIDRPPAD